MRTLALSLTLTTMSALAPAWAAASSPESAETDNLVGNRVGISVMSNSLRNPVGGRQLAAAGVIVNRRPGVPLPPAMPGASFLLADMDTGQILVARAPHAPHPPASTLKTLTALTLIPMLNVNRRIVVTAQDARAEGSHLGILPGTSYSVGTLLQGMLTTSGNDAAYALARGLRRDQGVAATLTAMNRTAAHLGAFDTVAKDPSGLDKAGQRSSAYDLALIGRAAMKLPTFRRYVLVKRASLSGGTAANGKRTPRLLISSHNKLLYNYPGAIGIKTGYTIAAKYSFIGAATRGGKTYLVTMMASPREGWRQSAALLDWAFAHGTAVTPVGRLVEPGTATRSGPRPPGPQASKQVEAGRHQSPPASSPHGSASQGALPTIPAIPALPAMVGAAVGIGALALAGAWAGRQISRRRR